MEKIKMTFVTNVGVNLVSATLQGLGGKAFGFVGTYRERPEKLTKLADFEQQTKATAINSLSTNEKIIEEIMAIALTRTNMELHRMLDTTRTKLLAIRHTMENASLMLYPNSAVRPDIIISNISLFNVAIVYHCFVIENKCTRFRDDYEFEPSMDVKEILRDIRASTTALESIWNLRPKTILNEESAKALKEQLKNITKEVVELIEKISESSFVEAEIAFKEVSLKKPRLLGKGRYLDTLGEVMIATIKDAGLNEMNNIDIRDNILKRYLGIELRVEDMEKAARQLLDKRLIHGIREEEKHYVIELRKSSESPTCGNCKRSGGYMVNYYTCSKGFVCDKCISFFGNCKVCGDKIKNEDHKLVV